jgi:hypothetical protein
VIPHTGCKCVSVGNGVGANSQMIPYPRDNVANAGHMQPWSGFNPPTWNYSSSFWY